MDKVSYGMTELSKIPSSWELSELEGLVKIHSGKSPSKFELHSDPVGYPFFKVNDLNFTMKYLENANAYFEKQQVSLMNEGMIVFPKRGAAIFTNKIAILGREGFFDTNIMGLETKEKLHNEFLFYFLKYIGLDQFADTSSVPQINNKHINPLQVLVPPIQEQEKIADILSTVDFLIEQNDQLIKKTRNLKKGLLQRLTTKGMNHTEFKESDLGKIPAEWEVCPMGKYLKLQGGFAFRSNQFTEEGIKIVRISNIKDGSIDLEDYVCYSEEDSLGLENYYLSENDTVIAMSGATTGKIGLIEEENLPCLLNQRVGRFAVENHNKVHKKYVYYLTTTHYFQDKIWDFAIGGAQPNISGKQIESIMVAIPGIKEQEEISCILSSLDDNLSQYENRKEKLHSLQKGMMQKLLTGKIRVKL